MEKRLIWKKKVASLRVICSRGSCWVTWRGSTDIVLQAGQCLEVRKVRGLCVEFLQQGDGYVEEYDVTAAQRAAFPLPWSTLGMQSSSRACW